MEYQKKHTRSEFLVQSASSGIVNQKQIHSIGCYVISSFLGKMQVSGLFWTSQFSDEHESDGAGAMQ
jgi:hypothetical protein